MNLIHVVVCSFSSTFPLNMHLIFSNFEALAETGYLLPQQVEVHYLCLMIKNLVFDFGNVLFDIDESITEKWLAEQLDPEKSKDLMEQVLYPFERGEISEEAFFNRLQRRSKKVLEGSFYYKAWNAMLLGMPAHRFHFLQKLRQSHRVYLLSNNNITHYRALKKIIAEQTSFIAFEKECFDKTYYSFEMGLRKPEKACYEFVLTDTGISAKETLFIDDKLENIQSAAAMGIHVHHHDPSQDIVEIVPMLLQSTY